MVLKTADFAFGKSNFYLQMTNGKEPFTIMHSHEFYEIVCIISGGYHQTINSKNIYMKQHSVTLLRPWDTHQPTHQVPGTNVLSVSIKEECVQAFLTAYGKVFSNLIISRDMPPFIETDTNATSYIADAYSSLATLNSDEREMYCNILLSKVLLSFASQNQMLRNSSTITNSHSKAILFEAINQMNKPENIAEGIIALQRISGYSRPQLCRLMKKYLNQTPYEYTHKLRMNFAYNLLTHTGFPISVIAEKSGFSSTSHFVSSFKKQFGITPLQKRSEVYTHTI